MVQGLTFTSDFGKYEMDTLWPPGHPRYGESTAHMLQSGDWAWGGQPTNRSGLVNYNDRLAGGASLLGVTNVDLGDPMPTCTAWDFQMQITIADWPAEANAGVVFLGVGGLRVGVTRAGHLFTLGKATDHTESTGLLFTGGLFGLHVEMTPGGPWWVRLFVDGALATTVCGSSWTGGELSGASFGCASVSGATGNVAVLTSTFCAGQMSSAASPVECPHAPPVGPGRRAWALWWPP